MGHFWRGSLTTPVGNREGTRWVLMEGRRRLSSSAAGHRVPPGSGAPANVGGSVVGLLLWSYKAEGYEKAMASPALTLRPLT